MSQWRRYEGAAAAAAAAGRARREGARRSQAAARCLACVLAGQPAVCLANSSIGRPSTALEAAAAAAAARVTGGPRSSGGPASLGRTSGMRARRPARTAAA